MEYSAVFGSEKKIIKKFENGIKSNFIT